MTTNYCKYVERITVIVQEFVACTGTTNLKTSVGGGGGAAAAATAAAAAAAAAVVGNLTCLPKLYQAKIVKPPVPSLLTVC